MGSSDDSAVNPSPPSPPLEGGGERIRRKLDARRRHLPKAATPFLICRKAARRFRLAVAVVLMILGSASLAYFQFVVLKMLPFDNKSEFQVVLDMRSARRSRRRARAAPDRRRTGAGSDVVDYQAYAGTASPIKLPTAWSARLPVRRAGEGRIQVNLADKQHPDRARATKSRWPCATHRGRSGRKNGGVAKVVEAPPGRRCCRPSSPR